MTNDSLQLVESDPRGISLFERAGSDLRCLYTNPSGLAINNGLVSPGTLLCEVLPGHRDPVHDGRSLLQIYQGVLDTGIPWHEIIPFSGDVNGDWFKVSAVPMGGDRVAIYYEDATNDQEQKLRDPLTGLYNRNALQLFEGRFESVLFLDLDRFKAINDVRGHPLGDRVLKAIADELQAIARIHNAFAVRIGGDEFLILFIGNDAIDSAVDCWLAIKSTEIEGANCSVSIGVADHLSGDIELAYGRGDLASQKAKESKGNEQPEYRIVEWSLDLHEKSQHRQKITKLMSDPPNLDFALAFQPIVHINTGAIKGCEALIRIPDVSPEEAIRTAEQLNKMAQVTERVLLQAIAALKQWEAIAPDCSVSINVSPGELQTPGFAERFLRTLAQNGIHPGQINIEVTERGFLSHLREYQTNILALQETRLTLNLDDFGSGDSGLWILTNFRFPFVKIDRGLIVQPHDPGQVKARKIVLCRSLVNASEEMEFTLIAEGIETEEQRSLLAGMGIPLAQGYLFSRPLSLDAFLERIEGDRSNYSSLTR
ncbi:MAG: bifunctional diguanylate cyclase/phosphodiesterase [Cyanobacteria bacterium J06638_20]